MLSAAGAEEPYYFLEFSPSGLGNGDVQKMQNTALGAPNGVVIACNIPGNFGGGYYGYGVHIKKNGTLKNGTAITTSRNTFSKPMYDAFINSSGNGVYITSESSYNIVYTVNGSGNEVSVYESIMSLGDDKSYSYQMENGEVVYWAPNNGLVGNYDINSPSSQGWTSTISPSNPSGDWGITGSGFSSAYNSGTEYAISTPSDNESGAYASGLISMSATSDYAVPSTINMIKLLSGRSTSATQQSTAVCCDSSNIYALHASSLSNNNLNGVYLLKYATSTATEIWNGSLSFDWSSYTQFRVEDNNTAGFDFDEEGNIIGHFFGIDDNATTEPDKYVIYIFSITNTSTPSCNWAYKINLDVNTVPNSDCRIRVSKGFIMDRDAKSFYVNGSVFDPSYTIIGTLYAPFLLRLPTNGEITTGVYGDSKLKITDVTSNFNYNTSNTCVVTNYPHTTTVTTGTNNAITDKTSSYAASAYNGFTSDLTEL